MNWLERTKDALDTRQAKIYGIAFALYLTITIVAVALLPIPWSFKLVMSIVTVVFATPMILLGMYHVACLTKGKCVVLSWVVVVIVSLSLTFASLAIVFGVRGVNRAMKKR
jgi:hypothetical protein